MSVTAAKGFVAASGAIGVKPGGAPDFALVATTEGRPVPAAAVFTQNLAAAAPVLVSREHLALSGGRAAAVVLTSGNANAATGAGGMTIARSLCAAGASALDVATHEILVAQTGLIGVPFPAGAVEMVRGVVASRSSGASAGRGAAMAIMTTDTVPKEAVASAEGCVVGGMAKGAAMLAPNLATMLAVLTTDAEVDPVTLHGILAEAVEPTFNRLSVDGCTSTNDTVVL
ncbi:MAG: bifunctional ornithine acetyltransferase/N-acetylglutamate synthase, partial [Solirubrobacteraceae bacterium]